MPNRPNSLQICWQVHPIHAFSETWKVIHYSMKLLENIHTGNYFSATISNSEHSVEGWTINSNKIKRGQNQRSNLGFYLDVAITNWLCLTRTIFSRQTTDRSKQNRSKTVCLLKLKNHVSWKLFRFKSISRAFPHQGKDWGSTPDRGHF